MRKVLVIGPGGAGKSTFARVLAERTGLPLVHLDALHWRPGWTPPSNEEWLETVDRLVREPRWVMDGNYGGTLDRRMSACDTVIFLDLPRRLCLWRVLRRRIEHRGTVRDDMGPGCPERLTLDFLAWIWNYRRRKRPGVLRRLSELGPGQRSVVLTSPREVERFLESMPPRRDAP